MKRMLIGLIIVIAIGTAGVLWVRHVGNALPGRGKIDPEEVHPGPRPVPPASPIERLRMAWDSESQAEWPASDVLATISETAYLTPVEAETKYRTLGFKQVKTFVDASMIGYVVAADDVAVIAFRGTDDRPDWLVNLSRGTLDTPHGAIHRGFYSAYRPLKPQILALLDQTEAKHVWITGHSLGGALAVVCAYDLIDKEQRSLDGLVTFGQPMVAREQLANHLDVVLLGRYARYVNEADVVPRIPPRHTHCGSLVWFTQGGIKRSKAKRVAYGAPAPGGAPNEIEADEGPPPLSEEEFELLKLELRPEDAPPDTLPDGTQVYRGNSPWIRDHSMELYLDKILSVFNSSGE